MPKGRGAQKRRQSERQKNPKDKRGTVGRGYLKLLALGERAAEVSEVRRKARPVGRAVAQHRARSEKRADARRKARRKWAA